jgi:L-arabinose isomerase
MRCVYCKKPVLGSDPITVPGAGPAHHICYQTRLTAERIFKGLNIAKLDDIQFNELSDLVLMEKNMRMPAVEKSDESFEVELF